MTRLSKRHMDLDPDSPNGLTGEDISLAAGLGSIAANFAKLGSVLMVREQFNQNTAGGTSVVGWNTRKLNTVIANTIDGAYINTTTWTITLPSGMYLVDAAGSMYYAGGTILRLYDHEKGVLIHHGAADWMRNANNDTDFASMHGVITVPSNTNMRLQQYATSGRNTNGMGLPINIAGLPEIYATLRLLKIK